MKVYIGPYTGWFGPYQLCDLLRFVGVSEEKRHKLASKINEKPFQWFQDTFRKRKIKVKIHNYDVWGMDHTLALIILPMLKLLKEKKQGSPFVDDEDVPTELHRSSAKPVENEWDVDEFFHKRWEWVLDEMIYSFTMITEEEDWESELISPQKTALETQQMWEKHKAIQNRISNGFRLFGKYFQSLWD